MLKNIPKFSVENPVLVNLLTVAILIGGFYGVMTIVRDLLPETRPNKVQIITEYPGASPEDVETGVTRKIEEKIKDLDGVDEIYSVVMEGLSTIMVEVRRDYNIDRAVDDIKAAIDTIDDFPEEVEESRVMRWEPKWPVLSVCIYGNISEKQLKRLVDQMRDEIMDAAGVNHIALYGVRDEQINIEVDPELLQAHRLSLLDIVNAIHRANLDLPGGQIKLPTENVSVRTIGEKRQAEAIKQIIVRAQPDGRIITVGRIARVIDGFTDVDMYLRFRGKLAAAITVFRTADQDAIAISEKVHAFVAGKMGKPFQHNWKSRLLSLLGRECEAEKIWRLARSRPLPEGVKLAIVEDLSRLIKDRLDLLRRNGFWGLLLVFLSLLIFLNKWVAIWVMSGVLVSIMGTFIVMQWTGLTLNMVSMFGMIMALGLLVDDAIVVGESVYRRIERGLLPKAAAITGTQEVANPVVAAIATTLAAFIPLTMIKGKMGDFIWVLPVVAGIALLISLLEALVILPSHLAEFLKPTRPEEQKRGRCARLVERIRAAFATVNWQRQYERVLRKALEYRYITLAVAISAIMGISGLILGGRLETTFFPPMDTDFLLVTVRMPVGTPVGQTEAVLSQIEKAVEEMPEVNYYYSLVGALASQEEPVLAAVQSNIGQIMIELHPAETRTRTSDEILNILREKTKNLSGVDSIEFIAWGGAFAGPDISIEVSGERLEDLLPAVQHLKDRLRDFDGVYNINDDFEAGTREIRVELLPAARTLGLDTLSVAQQIRSAFHGLTARTIQRGRDAVDIVVRYPRQYRGRISTLEKMWISTPTGLRVPLREIADLTEGVGYAVIKRHDRRRAITVSAAVDRSRANPDDIMEVLESEYPSFEAAHPGVKLISTGTRREATKAFGSLRVGFVVAAILIYVCLAWLFASYIQPLIVMVSIPAAFVGVAVGHLVMGYPITIMSKIGYVALAGIAVNDALILVDYANQAVRQGASRHEAAVAAGLRRLRPILLTSVTTILGLAPLMAERSFQARFLIPMAISVTFGLAFATLITLLLVPALYLVLEDVKRAAVRIWSGPQPASSVAAE